MAIWSPTIHALKEKAAGHHRSIHKSAATRCRAFPALTRRRRFKLSTGSIPVLPLSPGRAERHGFEYYRHGTLSFCTAALDVKTGQVQGMTAGRHTSKQFVAFPRRLGGAYRMGQADSCGARQSLRAPRPRTVDHFLAQHPHVRFHFTPTYSSWLNQVELWFARIQRDVIRRGVFTSVADLGRKLRRYIPASIPNQPSSFSLDLYGSHPQNPP